MIWTRLREKSERRSEAEAETAFMLFLDFAHIESETANEMIERYETTLQNCLDQGVVVDNDMRQRTLIGRLAERYKFLKQNYLLANTATKPNLDALKAQQRDIDSDYRKPNFGVKTKAGHGHRAKIEAKWGKKSNSGSDKRRDKYSGRGGSGSGQGIRTLKGKSVLALGQAHSHS